jgi:hypothetical protein
MIRLRSKTRPFHLYGYDRSATLGDAATLNDATRNDATPADTCTS